jgi:hypothetical protein
MISSVLSSVSETVQTALPVCLPPWRENPYRLVSLADIVERFDLLHFGNIMTVLRDAQHNCHVLRTVPAGQAMLDFAWIRRIVDDYTHYCARAGFSDCESRGKGLAIALRNMTDLAVIATYLHTLEDDILLESKKHIFLNIRPAQSGYFDRAELFEKKVYDAFASARFDIKEAGNCRAAGLDTASIFHLMRAVEWGLRALCIDLGFRRVRRRNKKTGAVTYIPLGWSDWETLLSQLNSRVTERNNKLKRGPKKQLYQEFYHPAIQDIEAMKEAFRNHVMHTRREYTESEAKPIFDRVQALMMNLATRISE